MFRIPSNRFGEISRPASKFNDFSQVALFKQLLNDCLPKTLTNDVLCELIVSAGVLTPIGFFSEFCIVDTPSTLQR
jgi:hypothetical protein